MSMGGEGHVEVEYQAGKLVLISNYNIVATNKYGFYAELL